MSCCSNRNALETKINHSMAGLQHSVRLCDGMYFLTLPSDEVPATCPVAMVILSGWTARLSGARKRPKGQ